MMKRGLILFTVRKPHGNTVINLIVAAVNDPGSFTGNTSATGSEDDSAITGTLVFTDAIDGDSAPSYPRLHDYAITERGPAKRQL